MESNEKRLAVILVGVVVVLGAGGFVGARVLRGDSGEATFGGPTSRTTGEPGDLEERIERLEKVITGLRADILRLSGSDRRSSGGLAKGGTADSTTPGPIVPMAVAETIEWLRDPEVRDVLLNTIEEEEEIRDELREQERRTQIATRTKRELSIMADSLGLNMFQQDSIGEIEAELDAKRLDIERRASEILLRPGALDDATKEEYRGLLAEKRDAYSARTDQLKSLLGNDGFKAFRGYELDQLRREDFFDNIAYDGFLHDKKNNRKNPAGNKAKQNAKKKSPPKR